MAKTTTTTVAEPPPPREPRAPRRSAAPATTLTVKGVEALAPRARRYHVKDTEVDGLELRVSPDGRKVWSLRYRIHGLQKRLKLGRHPALGLLEARKEANAALRQVDAEIDPFEVRENRKQAALAARKQAAEANALAQQNTVEAWATSYVNRHAKPRKRTWAADERNIRREILSQWAGRAVTSITKNDCRALIEGIFDRGAPIVSNRIFALLSVMFNHAVKRGLIKLEANPMLGLEKLGVEFDKRPETDQGATAYVAGEVKAIWDNTEHLAAPVRTQIRLQLLTATRPGEVLHMRWSEVAPDRCWWTIPASRSKSKRPMRVFLCETAREELARVPQVDREDRVFRGVSGKRQRALANRAVFAGVLARAKPRHRLRNTAATLMAEGGVFDEMVSRVLGHSVGLRVTAGYVSHNFDPEKQRALLALERSIKAIVDPQEATATGKVLAFAGSEADVA